MFTVAYVFINAKEYRKISDKITPHYIKSIGNGKLMIGT
jgi:hypothetical protein